MKSRGGRWGKRARWGVRGDREGKEWKGSEREGGEDDNSKRWGQRGKWEWLVRDNGTKMGI